MRRSSLRPSVRSVLPLLLASAGFGCEREPRVGTGGQPVLSTMRVGIDGGAVSSRGEEEQPVDEGATRSACYFACRGEADAALEVCLTVGVDSGGGDCRDASVARLEACLGDSGCRERASPDTDESEAGSREEARSGGCDAPARTLEEQAVADCWSACVGAAFPGLIGCQEAGVDSGTCKSAFSGEVYACAAARCAGGRSPVDGSVSEDEGSSPGGDASGASAPPPQDRYEGAFCGADVFIQTDRISRQDALDNCLLNEAQNPGRGVFCTWNDDVIHDGCGSNGGAAPAPTACAGWEPSAFERVPEFFGTTFASADAMFCDGPAFRRLDARYGLWVGLVSCGGGYRFYLSATSDGPYLPAADSGGHGQDLCELVDTAFSLPLEDDITSGGCTTCSTGANHSFVAGEVYLRSALGQPFVRTDAIAWGGYQSSVITCATGPLECVVVGR